MIDYLADAVTQCLLKSMHILGKGQKLLSQGFTLGALNKSHVIGHIGRNVLHFTACNYFNAIILWWFYHQPSLAVPMACQYYAILCNSTDSDQCFLSATTLQHRYSPHVTYCHIYYVLYLSYHSPKDDLFLTLTKQILSTKPFSAHFILKVCFEVLNRQQSPCCTKLMVKGVGNAS